MTNYVLLYFGGMMPEGEDEKKKVMDAWGAWYGKMGEAIVDGGNPFGATEVVGAGSSSGASGYTIITADSLQAAAEAVADHPHLSAGEDARVEVHETFEVEM